MNSGIALSVLIVGQRDRLTPRSLESLKALRSFNEIEAIFVDSYPLSEGPPLPDGVLALEGVQGSYFDHLQRGLLKARGEWVVMLNTDEHLQVNALKALLVELEASTQSLRHARVLLHNPEDSAREELSGAPSCSFATMLRWWRITEVPHLSGLFIRRSVLTHVLEQVSVPERFGRYTAAVLASKGGASVALPLCSSMAVFTPQSAEVAERDRIRGVQLEIAELSPLAQSDLWREYYEWCVHSTATLFTPIMLPQTRAQAQGLAAMLGKSKRSIFEALWFVYRDVETSKQAALLLTKWGLIADDNGPVVGASDAFKRLGSYLATELNHREIDNVLVVNEDIAASPASMIARLLKDLDKFGVSVCAVSRKHVDDRGLIAGLAHRGLLGWIRSIRPSSENTEGGGLQRLLGRAVDENAGKIDCVVVASDDPLLEQEVSCLSQRIQNPFSLVIHGPEVAGTLSRVQSALGPYLSCALTVSEEGLAVIECGHKVERVDRATSF